MAIKGSLWLPPGLMHKLMSNGNLRKAHWSESEVH